MNQVRVLYTKRPYNIGSMAIRCANPVSFVKIAPASHGMVLDGDSGYVIEATMEYGVRRALLSEALHGCVVVNDVVYEVPDAEAGMQWLRDTARRGAPYDWPGALGLGLAPDRNWQQDTDWFCFELIANCLAKAGRPLFIDNAHVTAYMLMNVVPTLQQRAALLEFSQSAAL